MRKLRLLAAAPLVAGVLLTAGVGAASAQPAPPSNDQFVKFENCLKANGFTPPAHPQGHRQGPPPGGQPGQRPMGPPPGAKNGPPPIPPGAEKAFKACEALRPPPPKR